MFDVAARVASPQLYEGFSFADLLRRLIVILCEERRVCVLEMTVGLVDVTAVRLNFFEGE